MISYHLFEKNAKKTHWRVSWDAEPLPKITVATEGLVRDPRSKKCKFPGVHFYCVRGAPSSYKQCTAPKNIASVRYSLKVANLLISNNEPC